MGVGLIILWRGVWLQMSISFLGPKKAAKPRAANPWDLLDIRCNEVCLAAAGGRNQKGFRWPCFGFGVWGGCQGVSDCEWRKHQLQMDEGARKFQREEGRRGGSCSLGHINIRRLHFGWWILMWRNATCSWMWLKKCRMRGTENVGRREVFHCGWFDYQCVEGVV